MADDERGSERAFKVEDRRRFLDTGESRSGDEESTPSAPASTTSPDAPADAASPTDIPPEINFSTFVISLSAQALAHLGEIPDPVHHGVRVDLDAARQVIDILGMLREKTKGNLDSAEDPLLENILYDLRMKYVERAHRR
jgi:hypothetical protein